MACQRCYGEGTVVVCIDDICRNGGRCIHGDGEQDCPDCKGTGVDAGEDDIDDDDDFTGWG